LTAALNLTQLYPYPTLCLAASVAEGDLMLNMSALRELAEGIEGRVGQLADQGIEGEGLVEWMRNYLDLQKILRGARDDALIALIEEFPGFAAFSKSVVRAQTKARARPSPALKAPPPEVLTASIELIRISAFIEAKYQAMVDAGPNGYSRNQVIDISLLHADWVLKVDAFFKTLQAQVPAKTLQGARDFFADLGFSILANVDKLLAQCRSS